MRIVIGDASHVQRERLQHALARTGDLEVAGVAATAAELIGAVRQLHPDAVVTDAAMRTDPRPSSMDGIAAAHAIRVEKADVGIVVVSDRPDEARAFELFNRGAAGLGYLLKGRVDEHDWLPRTLREVVAGGSVIDPLVVEVLVGRRARIRESPLGQLGPRELDLLNEMAQGLSDAAIGHALRLPEPQVREQVSMVFVKLGLVGDVRPDRRVETVLTFLRDTGLAGDRDR